MPIFDWMANLAIDSAGGKSKVFGSKPGVADYVPTDLGAEAKRAVKSNLDNAPDTLAYLEKILPGYGEMVKKGGANTLSLLSGEIPKDVQERVYRNAAFKSLAGGYAGSGMSRNLTGRDLGLTSLDLIERGTNSAQKWAGLTQGSMAPFTITAAGQADQTNRNNLYKQATEQFKYNVAAAPDPGAAGLFNTISVIGGTAASFGTMGMGGRSGGGGGSAPPSGGYSYNYAYPAPTYAVGGPTTNASGTAPYGWGG